MKLIIDIDDKDILFDIKNRGFTPQTTTDEIIIDALYNGIPYEEKPQGDLISRSALISAIEKSEGISWERYGDNEVCVRKKYIDNAQAVEAVPLEHHNKIKGIMDNEIKSLVDILDNERPLYEGVLFVDDYGINKVIEVDENGTVTAQMVIPRDAFIEAYNKFIKGE